MTLFSEEYFKVTKELMVIFDENKRFVEVSRPWERVLGWTIAELKTMKYTDLLHPEDLERSLEAEQFRKKNIYSKYQKYFENRYRKKDGRYVWLQWDGIFDEDGKLYCVARDIGLLKEKEFLYEEMQEISKIGTWRVTLGTNEYFASREIYAIHDLPKDASMGFFRTEHFPGEAQKILDSKIQNLIETREPYVIILPFISATGREKYVRCAGRYTETNGVKEVYGFLQDITEEILKQKELEAQRIKNINAAKMASLGEMAANIAHEINNPLSLILGRAEQLKNKVVENKVLTEELISGLDQIQKTSSRIAKVIKSLKTFSKPDEFSMFTKTPLKNIIEDSFELCYEKLKNNGYTVVVSEVPDIDINCRSAQLSQVFLNLISNSVDALAGEKEKWVKLNFKLNKDHVLIEFEDSGKGIEESIRERIMQPFFTTKGNKGTGLGLSISNSIISAHKGRIYYDGSKERTTFCIELPYTHRYAVPL